MGYYTFYTLEVYDKNGNIKTDEPIRDSSNLEEIMENEDCNSKLYKIARELKNSKNDFCYGIQSEEPSKWYEYEEDMKKLSKKYKDFVFVLAGEGEENGDVWKTYFCNGKAKLVRPEVRWPEVDIKEFVNELNSKLVRSEAKWPEVDIKEFVNDLDSK